ncbi:MAG: hypothetical protein OYH77_02240 [Pseudomonadota bacterium]|nr:hypothetical protein [Pseudomonadota bacterium]
MWTLIAIVFIVVACEKSPVYRGNIIGTNNVQPAAKIQSSGQMRPVVFERSIAASAFLVIGKQKKHCHGVLITNGKYPRVITSRRCFAEAGQTLDRSLCLHTRAYFNFSLPGRALHDRRCRTNSLIASRRYDLATFQLHAPLPPSHQALPIWHGAIPKYRDAFLLHYPHLIYNSFSPTHSVALLTAQSKYYPVAAITASDCTILGRPRSLAWADVPFGLAHNCDMTKGSLGGALIDLHSGHLLGLAWGGMTKHEPRGFRRLLVWSRPKPHVQQINLALSAPYLRIFMNQVIKVGW